MSRYGYEAKFGQARFTSAVTPASDIRPLTSVVGGNADVRGGGSSREAADDLVRNDGDYDDDEKRRGNHYNTHHS